MGRFLSRTFFFSRQKTAPIPALARRRAPPRFRQASNALAFVAVFWYATIGSDARMDGVTGAPEARGPNHTRRGLRPHAEPQLEVRTRHGTVGTRLERGAIESAFLSYVRLPRPISEGCVLAGKEMSLVSTVNVSVPGPVVRAAIGSERPFISGSMKVRASACRRNEVVVNACEGGY